MAVRVVVAGQYDGKSLAAAQRDLDQLKAKAAANQGPMKKLGSTMKSAVGPAMIGLGIAAAGAALELGKLAVQMGVEGVQAAIEDQKSVERLAQTLSNLGMAQDNARVEDFIRQLELAAGVADSDLRLAYGRLVLATKDAADAQSLLQAALDISAGTGQEFKTVYEALARAVGTGSAGRLAAYGIVVNDVTVKTQGMGAAILEAAGAFKGMADREAGTLEGQLRRVGIAVDNLKEAFGYGFLGGLGDTSQGLENTITTLDELQPKLKDLGETFGDLAATLMDLAPTLNAVVGYYNQAIQTSSMMLGIPIIQHFLDQGDAAEQLGINLMDLYESHINYRDAAVRSRGATEAAIIPTEEAAAAIEEAAAAAEKAAAEFDKLSGAISKTNAVISYQKAMDDLRKTLKETKGETTIFNDKGRESVDGYVNLAKSAGDYIETLDSQAQKVATAKGALDTLKTQLGKTKMDPATAAALLDPFQGLIDDLAEAGIDVSTLQAQLDKIKSKSVTFTVNYEFPDGRPPGGWPKEWYGAKGGEVPQYYAGGGPSRGSDTIPAMLAPGEFVMRRSAVKQFGADLFSQLNRGINPLAGMTPSGRGGGSGINIGSITVQSAPNEQAAESLPRALRRMAFMAGV